MQLVKRGSSWAYDMRVNNRRYRKKGFKTKKEAQAAANKRYEDLSKGIDTDKVISFSKYLLDWIEFYKKPYVNPTTYNHYYGIYKKVLEYFDNTKLNYITREQYQKFLIYFKNKLSQDQLGRIHALCKKVIGAAIYDGLISKDFTFNAQVISQKPPKKQEYDKYLNIDELKQIKQYFINKTPYLSASTHIILLMIETGGRFSDCINLKTKDINKSKGQIFLNGTKNDSAPRYISVSANLIKILLNYAKQTPTQINGYLFTHNGKQITNTTVNKAVKEACKQLNIKRNITSHAFRHTHASYLIHKGLNIYYISKRLGHSDISVTLNKYGHLLKESQEKEDEKAVKLVSEI